jgi:hypothetical protein
VQSTAPAEATSVVGHQTKVPEHYVLPPTVPSPFTGTLEASLDALREFARIRPKLIKLTDPLLEEVNSKTNWLDLMSTFLATDKDARALLEELFFLVTRKLLPEQIAENRALMHKMYTEKGKLSKLVILRYDMLRESKKDGKAHSVLVESRAPQSPPLEPPAPVSNPLYPNRSPFLPNIMSTLIAAPAEGWPSKRMGDNMRHHTTALDGCLMRRDEEVGGWSEAKFLMEAVSVVLQWQWLRENTDRLGDMEVDNFDKLDGTAGENEWVKDV